MWRVCFSLVLLLCGVFQWSSVSGALALTINLHSGDTIHINRTETALVKCDVCVGNVCQSAVALRQDTEVNFTCQQPEDIFTVEIIKHIECSAKCNGSITPEQYPSLQSFSRTFTWNVKAPQKAFSVDFTKAGLRQIKPTESCQDKHVYTVFTGTTTVGRFCRLGTIKGIQVPLEGSVSLKVPGKEQLDPTTFGISVKNEIKLLAIINVALPEADSSQEFFSPNYPNSFPDDDEVTWSFLVPPKYYTTMRIQNYTETKCRKQDVRLEYQLNGKRMVKMLSDAQLSEYPGPFNLTLQNCKMEPTSSLTLHFKTSAVKRGNEVRCTVDLKKEEGLEMRIKKKKTNSTCILKQSSLIQDTITISSAKVAHLTLIECKEDDLQLNIYQNIVCQKQTNCTSSEFSLKVPVLERCLPGVLEQVTWHLYSPQHGAVELMSPLGSLQQSLPGQTCNSSLLFTVTEKDQPGITMGHYCPQGAIQKIQIRSNITVTAFPAAGQDLRQMTYPLLKGSFTETIPESYIFTVLPKKDTSVLLATPAWPAGMRPYATVSWIVSFSPPFEAQLEFTNISQVSCQSHPTSIKVQKQGSRGEAYSWRIDEKPKAVVLEESFYLNMSNCHQPKGTFSVVSQITLLKRKNMLLSIVLSVVSVVLVLMVVALAVVCVINRKKKKQKAPEVSVYNTNGHAFLPGLHGFPQTAEDEDFHIYHSIDDTLVYSHLLKGGIEMKRFQPTVDTYQAFTGPVERQPLKEHEEDKGTDVGVYRPFSGPHIPPELPDRSPKQGGRPAIKDEQMAVKESEDQTHGTLALQRAPIIEPEVDDSEIKH
ncbi:CUB domain-containing protein 1a [Hoplias malabaricus]|uniref:CUB domain-containing protein 1a n=1 Tax=Hoplias malabaricus TaxID=27720 RepID=UPI003461A0E4